MATIISQSLMRYLQITIISPKTKEKQNPEDLRRFLFIKKNEISDKSILELQINSLLIQLIASALDYTKPPGQQFPSCS